ncbi:unnamed protein product [Amoebophrya sp. A25]|nr:unnamed protein product [Amoebophrya sp. A25]|eukprot:GSA25T00000752001.1
MLLFLADEPPLYLYKADGHRLKITLRFVALIVFSAPLGGIAFPRPCVEYFDLLEGIMECTDRRIRNVEKERRDYVALQEKHYRECADLVESPCK